MDTNGTRFQLIQGYPDWASCSETENGQSPLDTQWQSMSLYDDTLRTGWDSEQAALTLRPHLYQFVTPPVSAPLNLANRRGTARDRHGNWYWIDSAATGLLTRQEQASAPTGPGNPSHFWSSADGIAPSSQVGSIFQSKPEDTLHLLKTAQGQLVQLRGLTVTEDQYLVVGVLQPAGILIFDLLTGGLPRLMTWPDTVNFAPFDMTPKPGGVWILDRDNTCYWALDRQFRVLPQAPAEEASQVSPFQQPSQSAKPHAQAQAPAGASSFVPPPQLVASHPVAIEGLPDDTVLILDSDPSEPFSRIYRYLNSQLQGLLVSTDAMKALIARDKVANFRLSGHDFAFVPEHTEAGYLIPDHLSILPTEGNQVYAFHISQQDNQFQLQPLPNFFPLHLCGGKGLVVADDQIYYDFSNAWVPLVEQQRPHYATEAVFFTPVYAPRPALDGKLPDCVWHRLLIDACIPPETVIQISSRTANEENDLTAASWHNEPPLLLRGDGPELPFVEKAIGEGNGTWELLFQKAQGRYLQLKIRLLGNGRATPRLYAMRIYYPRFSYLDHYLPAVYREDGQSASFLDRFLANLEGFYTAIEDKIAAAQMLFDPRSVPTEALDWLASWLGIACDFHWDTHRRRLFLKHAMHFFQYRGTSGALQMLLQLTFDPCPDESMLRNSLANRPHPSQGGTASRSSVRIIETFRIRPSASGHYQEYQQEQSATPTQVWQHFLAHRYENVAALNRAYQSNFASFDEVRMPDSSPPDGPALLDWSQFQIIVLPAHTTAHQFTVLLPAPATGTAEDYQYRLDLARRIIDIEKPTHTQYEVKFAIAAFCIGAARLGLDTFVDLGSRSPQFTGPMILGQGSLLEHYLASEHYQDVRNRMTLQ